MCETYEQWSDVRRVENRDAKEKNKKASGEDSESSSDTESDEDGEDGQRTSVKRSFMAKCMSRFSDMGRTLNCCNSFTI